MVENQIINKILEEHSIRLLTEYSITKEFFSTYISEIDYIYKHLQAYGNVPDKATFAEAFTDFDFQSVSEADEYLVDTLREEYVYRQSVPIVNELANRMKSNSFEGVRYLQSKMELLNALVAQKKPPMDLVSLAENRYKKWEEKQVSKDSFYIPTGFKELDNFIGGWNKEGELAVILMRTSQGKSWLLQYFLTHAWKIGKRVGMYEPEMSSLVTGYRFDTLYGNISNSGLNHGTEAKGYKEYIEKIKEKENPFFLIPSTEHIDVNDLKKFIRENRIEIMGVDGISYMKDCRGSKYDNLSTSLTHIAEDLMSLSIELGVPILTVVQSNRGDNRGKVVDKFPDLLNVRDSDGIAFNSTLVLSGYHKDGMMNLKLAKSRGSEDNKEISYYWDIDKGKFEYVPDNTSDNPDEKMIVENLKRQFEDEGDEDVF